MSTNFKVTQAPRRTAEGWETVLVGEGCTVKVYSAAIETSKRVAYSFIKPVNVLARDPEKPDRKLRQRGVRPLTEPATSPFPLPSEDDVLGDGE
jgi:hypothetical protein